jgi:hypothetical protein
MNDQSLYLLTEAAERTGLTVEAIRQRIKRGKLEAMKGNDGMLRVRLTTADLEAIDRSLTGHAVPTAPGQPVNDDRLLKALQEAAEARGEATALRERAEIAEARAERAEAAAATIPELRERAGRAEGEGAACASRSRPAKRGCGGRRRPGSPPRPSWRTGRPADRWRGLGGRSCTGGAGREPGRVEKSGGVRAGTQHPLAGEKRSFQCEP